MIKLNYDNKHNTVIVEFLGKVDFAQAQQHLFDIPNVLPEDKANFTLLVDLSAVESIDSKVQGPIKKAMDLFNFAGVTKIIRVIPHHNQDLGLNIMSFFHYSDEVIIVTLQSREEANERLQNERTEYGSKA